MSAKVGRKGDNVVNHRNVSSNSSDEEGVNDKIIQALTSKYNEFQGGGDLLGKTIEHLRENIKAGICLICIEDVERTEAIWSCQNCFCILHLVCIQRWAKDSIANVKEAAAYKGFNLPLIWCCPKCRAEYAEVAFPDRYKCFCGKVTNPTPDPWNAPHSCGETCGKLLKPECGHVCVLLCHSGACPPCPKQISNSCYCGQSPPRTLRCFSKNWSCGKICSKVLSCDAHQCPSVCHEGECPPCLVPTTLHCLCESPSPIIVPCSKLSTVTETGEPEFPVSCGKTCRKRLDCGTHKCDRICHENLCGTCEQSCPCGKKRAPCTGEAKGAGKPCEDTCERSLDCEIHFCQQKCHAGSCGSCLQMVVKKCKCSQYEKEVLCSKEFLCQTKCRNIRDCGVHPCNRKCCPGDCPPCRNPCGKTLSCKNHKCESICHRGPCYPCPVTAQVKCRCGQTIRFVPCGSERKCRPPDCSELCARPPKCDHPKIQNHRCHFGDCPKCRLVCGKEMECSHKCPAVCHSARIPGNQSKKIACPNCSQMVPTKCPLHKSVMVKCHRQNDNCEELCGRLLRCEEHSCSKRCHEKDIPGFSGCGECRDSCGKQRPKGCEHECSLGCHRGPCPECTLAAKVLCHCGTETLFVQCSNQGKMSESERSCKNQCPKKLACGHRCLSICHSSVCPELERCRRKVKLSCKCKHLKKEVECCYVVENDKVLECTPTTCGISKSPKETPAKKRTRKKKTSESDGITSPQDDTDKPSESDTADATCSKGSLLSSSKVAIIMIGVTALAIAFAFSIFTD